MPRRRLLEIAFAALVALTACQAPLAQKQSPAPLQPPPIAKELAAADQKLFSGDYDGAEKAYQAEIQKGTSGAAAHLAVLLVYESRFQEAVDQAQRGVDAKRDSASLARLCRALDWSESIPQALAACSQAVAARPVDPIAHIYYAETLSDSGRHDDAARQLRSADIYAYDTYARAELAREWANYHRQRGNSEEALNNLEIARKIQPSFPERTLELARQKYLATKPDSGRSLLEELRKSYSQNFHVLLAAGETAFVGLDANEAGSIFEAAAQLQPGSAAASLDQAELAVAAKRDFKTAHDLLLVALKKDPTQSGVYQYLRYLDLLVLKTNPDDELRPIAPNPPPLLSDSRKRALQSLNAPRAAAGLPALVEDGAMAEAAQAHAHYVLFNFGQTQIQGLGIHSEDPALPGFVDSSGLLRARHWGYTGGRGAEVIDSVFTPQSAVQLWIDSVFHRLPLTDREATVAGYGQAQVGLISVAVADFGLGPPAKGGGAVTYPVDQARDVPAAFNGNEVPDPLPTGVRPPTGYPITLQVGSGSTLVVSSARLIRPDGNDVSGFSLNPGRELGPNQWAFLASAPLIPGGRYTVDIQGQVDGQPLSKRWSFTVAG